ncbi:hypothetical protein L9F63_001628, partial [Diploptera punctata]
MGSESDDAADDLLDEMFNSMYHLEHEVNVSTDNCYILHMDSSRISRNKMAVSLSDHTCAVYDIERVEKMEHLSGHTAPVSNVKFSPLDDSLVYSSSYDGTVKLWDLRLKIKCVKEFKDDSEGTKNLKPLSDFDISCNGNFICGGTELIDDDAFILFWDARSSKLLGGYWESHVDDITQVHFHPEKQDVLATGSTDGLINIFDVSKPSEEEAILYSLNTESSVEKLKWLPAESKTDVLSCITHTQDLQLWQSDGAAPFLQFNRETVGSISQMKRNTGCYIVDVHSMATPGDMMMLVGNTAQQVQCLRTLTLLKKKLQPLSDLTGNKQIVRASCYNSQSGILVTGGEAGILSVWKPQSYADNDTASALKIESKKILKLHRKKPY